MRYKHDYELVKRLYLEQMSDGLLDRELLKNDYYTVKGVRIPDGTLSNYITKIRQEERENLTELVEEKTHYSERYIEIGTSELLDPDDIVRLHGRNPETFELATDGSTRSKIGSNNEQGYLINTYSKATFRPRQWRLTKENLRKIFEDIGWEQKRAEPITLKSDGLLYGPFKDTHFPFNTAKDYELAQGQFAGLLLSQYWDWVVMGVGSDMFHYNDSKGRTANDTFVAENMEVSIKKALNEAIKFYKPLIDLAQDRAKKVTVIWEHGNHDRDLSIAFAVALEWQYPDVEFIIEENEHYQILEYGGCLIGTTHGDQKKSAKAIGETFYRYFAEQIGRAKYAEVNVGHLHHRYSEEYISLHICGLSTASKPTQFENRIGKANSKDRTFIAKMYSKDGYIGERVLGR